jgi:hypothetical protein
MRQGSLYFNLTQMLPTLIISAFTLTVLSAPINDGYYYVYDLYKNNVVAVPVVGVPLTTVFQPYDQETDIYRRQTSQTNNQDPSQNSKNKGNQVSEQTKQNDVGVFQAGGDATQDPVIAYAAGENPSNPQNQISAYAADAPNNGQAPLIDMYDARLTEDKGS